jgi:hypothetical protein
VVTGRPPYRRDGREEREEGDDTRGQHVSGSESAGARERAVLACWAERRGVGHARERERGERGRAWAAAASGWAEKEGEGMQLAWIFVFLFQKCEIVFSFIYFVVNY